MSKFKDLTGMRFGRWEVLRRGKDYTSPKGKKVVQWLCRCDCGTVKDVGVNALRGNGSKSCGCFQKESARDRLKNRLVDIQGNKYGRWLVLSLNVVKSTKAKDSYWNCKCDCGTERVVVASNLKNGVSKSCGCLQRELNGQRASKQKGKNHPNWKEDNNCVTSLQKRIYNSVKYKAWRKAIFERDSYVCQKSKDKGRNGLHAHHIKSFAKIWKENNIVTYEQAMSCEELWNISNGITLSEEWHSGILTDKPEALHRIYGVHNYTAENFYNWMKGK